MLSMPMWTSLLSCLNPMPKIYQSKGRAVCTRPAGPDSGAGMRQTTPITSYITGSNPLHKVLISRFLSRISGVRSIAW